MRRTTGKTVVIGTAELTGSCCSDLAGLGPGTAGQYLEERPSLPTPLKTAPFGAFPSC